MGQLFRSGQTLKTVGERFGLTRERARQILAKCGICKLDASSHFPGHRSTLPLPRNKRTERWLEINGNLVATGRRVAG
ncbi:hypothetical protein HAP94_13095 [Acidithiobacillus ferrivorans]|nr:hypothetical protein [Acidithiobacillus ferrivorans]